MSSGNFFARVCLCGLLVCCGCLLVCCGGGGQEVARKKVRSVFTLVPVGCGAESSRVFTSSVEEGKSVNVGFKTGGQIMSLKVNEGDYVRKGEIIGSLDDADYRLAVGQLESQYRQMQSETARLEEMFKRGNVSPNDYEKAVSGLEQIRAQLEMTRNKLDYTRLVSPVSGYVVERYMEDGEMAGAGTPVFKIKDNSTLETSVSVPASLYECRGEITGCVGRSAVTGDEEIPLDIIGFVPDADNNSLFKLRLHIPSDVREKLIPGMSMTVRINMNASGAEGMHEVASRSLFTRDGKDYVWVVNRADSTIFAKEVKVIGAHSSGNNVVSGLTGDESVVAVGVHHLSEGDKVAIRGDVSNMKWD